MGRPAYSGGSCAVWCERVACATLLLAEYSASTGLQYKIVILIGRSEQLGIYQNDPAVLNAAESKSLLVDKRCRQHREQLPQLASVTPAWSS